MPLPESERRPVSSKTVRRILQFFRPFQLRVALTIVATIAVALIGLANPFLLKLVIDEAIPNRDLNRLYLYVGLSSDVSGVQQVVTDTATSIVSNVATARSTIIAIWLISWHMTLISLGLLPIFLFITFKVGEARRDVKTETQETMADMTSQVEETLSVSGMLLTKAFGRQSRAIAEFRTRNERLTLLQMKQQMIGGRFFMIIGSFFSVTPAFVYWYAGLQIIGGNSWLTIGDIVAFTTLQSRLFVPLGQMPNVQVEIQVAFALFDRIFEYLDLPVEIADRPEAVTVDPKQVR